MSSGRLLLIIALLLLLPARPGMAVEGTVFTLWPLLDYRQSPATDYTSVGLLGPLLKYESKGDEREFAIRPLLFHARDGSAETNYTEFLYPVATSRNEPGQSRFSGLTLLDYDFGDPDKQDSEGFTLFPLLFFGKDEEKGSYFALFPVGGKLYGRFGRDEIGFALFPLYGRTLRKGTTVTNIVWPFFARISGEGESGWKAWPLYGASSKEGVYRKRFALWPIFFDYHLGLDTDHPLHRRTVFPLYVGDESARGYSNTYLWPFFSHREDHVRDFEEWDFPWPLFRITRGSGKEVNRFLPFYADDRLGELRKRWYLWPLYKIEEAQTETYVRRRDRVLWFLFSRMEETYPQEEVLRRRRTSLWPLFTYEVEGGVRRFSTLSLLEPFFPESEGVAWNWSPLWRLYHRKTDGSGNEAVSLLWNLYWKERRGDDLAVELFPLFAYTREGEEGQDFRLLKGFLRYRSEPGGGRRLTFFFLPWGLHWGGEREPSQG